MNGLFQHLMVLIIEFNKIRFVHFISKFTPSRAAEDSFLDVHNKIDHLGGAANTIPTGAWYGVSVPFAASSLLFTSFSS